MIKTPDLVAAEPAVLPKSAQDRIDTISALRAAINAGVVELDAGLGAPLDFEELIGDARREHSSRLCKA